MKKGGKREGAGRPALPKGKKRRTFTCQLKPQTLDYIKKEAEDQKISQGQVVDRLVDDKK